MVLRGQYLERMTPIAAGDPPGAYHLDGLYHRGSKAPALLIAPPHPRGGGSMETTVVAEIAWAATREGHATLRFDYRGVGASQGESGGAGGDEEDIEAALLHLIDTAGGRPALCGVGHGAGASVRLASRRREISSLILVSPVIAGLRAAAKSLARAREPLPPLLIVFGEHDHEREPGAAALAEELGDHPRLELVSGGDRAFSKGLSEAGRLVAGFLAQGRH